VFTQKSSSDPRVERSWTVVQESFWTQPSSGNSTYSSTASFSISASDFNISGGVLYVIFKSFSGIEYASCNYTISKPMLPTFSLSPTSLSLPCGDQSARVFSVTSNNIPSGVTLTYNWSAPGWSGSSTTSSITLTPQSGTILPSNVTVRPVLNGVQQSQLTCTVSRASFTSSATISGPTNICSGLANYTIAGVTAGQSVSWGLSNTATASLLNPTNSGVTVNFNGTGAQTLSASITNQCGQTSVRTFVINNGSTTFSTTATLTGSTTAACTGTNRTFTINNLAAGLTVSWSVSNSNLATLSGSTNTQTTVTIIGSGSVSVIATISNSCGQSTTRTATLYGGVPVLTSFTCSSQGKDFCSGGQVFSCFSCVPELNLNDRITAAFSGMTTTEANLAANWE
jgi:hypothetical protein